MPDRPDIPRIGNGPSASDYKHTEAELALFRKETFAAIENVKKVVARRRKAPVWIKPTLAISATGAVGLLIVFAIQISLVPDKSNAPPPVSRVRSQPSRIQPVYPVDNAAVLPAEILLEWEAGKTYNYLTVVVLDEHGETVIEQELPGETVEFAADLPSGREYYWRVETSGMVKTPMQSFHVLAENAWLDIQTELKELGLQGRDADLGIGQIDNLDVLVEIQTLLVENKLHRLADSVEQRISEIRKMR